MTKEGIENSIVSVASMTAGAIGSRIIADKLPIKNNKLKRGLLIAGSIIAAASLDRKTTGRKVGQDMAVSMATTQTGYLLKEMFEEKLQEDSLFKTGLGNPVYIDYSSFEQPVFEQTAEFIS
ncbi:hypothetical protein ACQY1Q_06040 [Tenacibaculum sp. TC6]|uniref:hypothetical protein n=1 Tax=Tenacibaculum sp. TC6 TaxID=3423223 RepID=UPI003D3620D9